MDHEVAPCWRPEDERLLSELTEESAIALVWALQAPEGAPPLPARARCLARELSRSAAGRRAVELAVSTDAAFLARELAAVTIATAPLELVHALACYLDRLSDAHADAAADARARSATAAVEEHVTIERSTRARALACWARLFDEREHLAALALRASGAALGAETAAQAAETAALAAWNALGERADRAVAELDGDGATALAALAHTHEACRAAGASARATRALSTLADSARARAIGEALATLEAALREVRQGEDAAARAKPWLESLRRVWEWSSRDLAVEHFAVDEVSTLGWDVYRRSDWAALRSLLVPLADVFESLEARVRAHPDEHLAYSARCAQIFVFRSESAADWVREWDDAERALALCPTHRNARLILANLCLSRAISGLDGATLFTVKGEVESASRLIARAEQLFPQAKKLEPAKQRLAEAKRRVGAGVSP